MKIILSTSNLMCGGQSILRRPLYTKSNDELVNGLRENFELHKPSGKQAQPGIVPGWTSRQGDALHVPAFRPTLLTEPRENYSITLKLFYLPGIPVSRRCEHTRDAIDLVLKELGVNSVDLLIVSYPGVSFDADDDGEEERSVDERSSADSDESQNLDAQVKTWKTLEALQQNGTIAELGVSEFSTDRLDKFLPEVSIKPVVDQINLTDCCVVPKSLIMYAKDHNIELLTHYDCTDILPCGTTRELLGPGENNAGVLTSGPDSPADEPGLRGDIQPQWVIKYIAVVKDRGVIANKGYFALAQLTEPTDSTDVTASKES